MANISVRKLDDSIYKSLRLRAVKHGVSMEEEVRQIIAQVVSQPVDIGAIFRKNFGSKNGIDLIPIKPRAPHDPMDI